MRGLQFLLFGLLAAFSLASPTPERHKLSRRQSIANLAIQRAKALASKWSTNDIPIVEKREANSADYERALEAARNLAAAYSDAEVEARGLEERADSPAALARQRAEALAAKYSENDLTVEARSRIFRRRRIHP
ncbi:hypothetical protein FA13DRAFT_1731301 [Coprinellus micaceus]|uniref:DUF4398 domain-containing protein n=1 Tax=Coprinellus micaceus TaxID=71717 RepID=A0A4Y7TFJ9_COPMI|nr:hypothetical protein FA13DRAFT_1731301 [Coprinellus micaceus]